MKITLTNTALLCVAFALIASQNIWYALAFLMVTAAVWDDSRRDNEEREPAPDDAAEYIRLVGKFGGRQDEAQKYIERFKREASWTQPPNAVFKNYPAADPDALKESARIFFETNAPAGRVETVEGVQTFVKANDPAFKPARYDASHLQEHQEPAPGMTEHSNKPLQFLDAYGNPVTDPEPAPALKPQQWIVVSSGGYYFTKQDRFKGGQFATKEPHLAFKFDSEASAIAVANIHGGTAKPI